MQSSQRVYQLALFVLFLSLTVALVSLSLLKTSSSNAQDSRSFSFTNSSDNPVIGPFVNGDWDIDVVYSPQILTDNNQWFAFVIGNSNESDSASLGLAASEDGMSWTFNADNPLTTPNDNFSVTDYVVHKSGDTWSLYFDGSEVGQTDTSAIHQAFTTSINDGWTESDGIIDTGDIGMWDSQSIVPSAVVENEDGFNLYYTGTDDSGWLQIGFATSPDNAIWEKIDNPILSGDENAWDAGGVGYPSVRQSDNLWEMFYTGVDNSGEIYAIGYATSQDGLSWIKHPDNPIIPIADASTQPIDTSFWVQDDNYMVYYTQPDGIHLTIGQADGEEMVGEAQTMTPMPNDVSPTPPVGPEPVTYPDEVDDTMNCQNQELSIDSEVDISHVTTQQTTENAVTIQVHMVEPLTTDYSFAVLALLRAEQDLSAYVWETHASVERIGGIDPQTGELLDDQSNASVEHDQENGILTFTILDAEFDEFAIRSFHTPDENTQPQPTTCDMVGPFEFE